MSLVNECPACGSYLMPCTATATGIHPEAAAQPPLPVIRVTLKGRTRQYRLTGTVNGNDYDDEVVRVSHGTDYAYASLTAIPEYRQGDDLGKRAVPTGGTVEVLTFHKSLENAGRGNLDLRAAALSVRVIEITGKEEAGEPA
jgi:hypothetical protein